MGILRSANSFSTMSVYLYLANRMMEPSIPNSMTYSTGVNKDCRIEL